MDERVLIADILAGKYHLKAKLSNVVLKHLITKDIVFVLYPEHCILKSLVLFSWLHIILGTINNGSFKLQVSGKFMFA